MTQQYGATVNEAIQQAVWQVGGKATGAVLQIPGVACPCREPHISLFLSLLHFFLSLSLWSSLVSYYWRSYCPACALVVSSPYNSTKQHHKQTLFQFRVRHRGQSIVLNAALTSITNSLLSFQPPELYRRK